MCIEAHSLQELFKELVDELKSQWKKARLADTPQSSTFVDDFDWWRMHAVRQTVLYHLRDSEKYKHAKDTWREVGHGLRDEDNTDDITLLVTKMLEDEKVFNKALEACPQDHGRE